MPKVFRPFGAEFPLSDFYEVSGAEPGASLKDFPFEIVNGVNENGEGGRFLMLKGDEPPPAAPPAPEPPVGDPAEPGP